MTSEVDTYKKVPEDILSIIPSIKKPDFEKYIPIKIPKGVKNENIVNIFKNIDVSIFAL